MADPRGFLKHDRELPSHRPVPVRLRDWKEVYEDFPEDKIRTQASRCMDCGIPFCNNGCPLGNIIPDWNDLTYRGLWHDAIDRLHATNNFPEFTGRLCPAPCESACSRHSRAARRDQTDRGRDHRPRIRRRLGRADASCHQDGQEGRRGRLRPCRTCGCTAAHPRRARCGRLRARRSHRWSAALRHPRIQDGEASPRPSPRANGGRGDGVPHQRERGGRCHRRRARAEHDAVVLCCGATQARDLPIEGRELSGIHQAMEFLPWANKVQEGDLDESPISAEGKDVIIIGGGDTGADCLGTSHATAPGRSTSSRSCRALRRNGPTKPMAHLSDGLQGHLRPRRGRSANTRSTPCASSATRTEISPASTPFESSRSSPTATCASSRSRAVSSTSRPDGVSCNGLHRPGTERPRRAVRRRSHRPRQCRPRRRLGHQRRRRVRRR